jgi:hypothetical protein
VKATRFFLSVIPIAASLCFLGAPAARPRPAQDSSQKPAEKAPGKIQEKTQEIPAAKASPKIPAEIALLETRIRFATDGSSRKEVHARVKINDELGARQFARLNFDFNRSFEQIEIPLVRITHPSGGVVDVLPSAITDTPNPAVVNAPAYQDVRVKSVRILGLEPGDSLEYRVITTVSHHPLAPDFWLDHSFDRTGVVSQEIFELDLPASRKVQFHVEPRFQYETHSSQSTTDARVEYSWHRKTTVTGAEPTKESNSSEPDVVLTTFQNWGDFVNRVAPHLMGYPTVSEVVAKAAEFSSAATTPDDKFRALYDFVSEKIVTVDLPLGTTGFQGRPPLEVISSGYAIPEEKCALLSVLGSGIKNGPIVAPALALSIDASKDKPPRISAFSKILVQATVAGKDFWLDPSIEVAPFGLVPSNLFGKFALRFFYRSDSDQFDEITTSFPFASSQRVTIDAALVGDGKLTVKAKYTMRGDNELLLRVAFHKTPKENWKNVAQLLALSDGFRGQITNVTASDPYATHDPFTVEYEIAQPKFVDWSKKPLRIPALLPLLGLPDPPTKPAPGAAVTPIDLGTPLDVEISATIRLPPGTTARIPTGTSVSRDFATYSSQYSAKDATLTASRHLNFILKEIPADRAGDYNAFLRAVQNDESQVFTLERADTTPAAPKKP